MEAIEKKSSLGYGKPPWIFKGSALYQLHLVKSETARAFIPKEFKLVEAFGYTLGGFFLANYEESPAGIFDELVVIAGIVWNPPTSCAWAAKVLVNSDKACIHGRKDVGLPSEFAHFTKNVVSMPRIQKRDRFGGFWSTIGSNGHEMNRTDMRVKEMSDDRSTPIDICNISLKTSAMATPQIDSNWMGPSIKMSLPSFSGRTEYNPHLLKYSCEIECRLRLVSPAQVFGPSQLNENEETSTSERRVSNVGIVKAEDDKDYKRDLCLSILLSKPILALEFNRLNMKVEAPTQLELNNHS